MANTAEPTNADLAAIVRELAESLDGLRKDIEPLAPEMREYREKFEAVEPNRTRAWIAGVLAFLLLGGGVITSIVVSRSSADVIQRIRDCTEAGGQCYEANSVRSKQNVQVIVQAICMSTPPERRATPPCPAP